MTSTQGRRFQKQVRDPLNASRSFLPEKPGGVRKET